jgi:hypothetical protein
VITYLCKPLQVIQKVNLHQALEEAHWRFENKSDISS